MRKDTPFSFWICNTGTETLYDVDIINEQLRPDLVKVCNFGNAEYHKEVAALKDGVTAGLIILQIRNYKSESALQDQRTAILKADDIELNGTISPYGGSPIDIIGVCEPVSFNMASTLVLSKLLSGIGVEVKIYPSKP